MSTGYKEDLKKWIQDYQLDVVWESEDTFSIPTVGSFLFIEPKEGLILFPDKRLNLTDEEKKKKEKVDFFCYPLGTQFFYSSGIVMKELYPLKYLGKAVDSEMKIPFLGIHGEYEILNGSREYKLWVQKAKFLGIETLGICEKHTLTGTLHLQKYCHENGMKSILGETFVVKREDESRYEVKLYIIDEKGWKNLLLNNYEVTTQEKGYLEEKSLLERSEGLVVVVDPKYTSYNEDLLKTLEKEFKKENCYFGIDTLEYEDNARDREYILNQMEYLGNCDWKPILLCDAYYLDKRDAIVKDRLNTISSKRDYQSYDQYFKTGEQCLEEFGIFFQKEGSDEVLFELFESLIKNTKELSDKCLFQISVQNRYFPQYHMNEDQKKQYSNNKELFLSLLEKGIEKKHPEGIPENYMERVEKEYQVIEEAGYIDYFLILWDTYRFCRENGILTGLGRGSAAGCIIAWYLELTQINPLKYNLLFERFLNPGRVFKDKMLKRTVVVDEEGQEHLFDPDEKVDIIRNGRKRTILYKNLKEGDEVIES